MFYCSITLIHLLEVCVLALYFNKGVIIPYFGQLCAGFRKSNKYHHNLDKITYPVISNMVRYAILHTKIIISNLGSSLMLELSF